MDKKNNNIYKRKSDDDLMSGLDDDLMSGLDDLEIDNDKSINTNETILAKRNCSSNRNCSSAQIDREFDTIKKIKIEYDISNLETLISCFSVNSSESNNLDKLDNQIGSYMDISDNNLSDILKENEQPSLTIDLTIKDRFDQIKNLNAILVNNNTFDYKKLQIICKYIINQYRPEEIKQGKLKDDSLQKELYEKISLMLYPSYLIVPYILDPCPESNYVDKRIDSLEKIYPESRSFFPTWKKLHNYNIEYNFLDLHTIHSKICINFTVKIFKFYERVYTVYFNIIFGELLSNLLSNYKIILNPLDIKFNRLQFDKWAEGFSKVLENCKSFIFKMTNSIHIEKIDELDQHDLTKLLNKLNGDFIEDFEKNKNSFVSLFEPLKEFYKESYSNTFVSSRCLDNINTEIIQIFKFKQYIKILSKNKWVGRFVY
jgi:hypothetical protein